jgi:hypothetical protein
MFIKTYHWPFSKKKKKRKEKRKKEKQYACAHTPVTLCTIKGLGKGENKRQRK